MIAASELILNEDGSVYHLHLRPEHIANTIITVGDPERVAEVGKYFDSIEYCIQKREFVTHTGYIGEHRLSVISTGIGTDNIDIVLNELDALVNIDLETREIRPNHTSLDIIRIGTSGALQADIEVDSFLVSEYGIGFDGLMPFYEVDYNEFELELAKSLVDHIPELPILPYSVAADASWVDIFSKRGFQKGNTLTCTGFYAPQGRSLRLRPAIHDFIDRVAKFRLNDFRFTNFEMETAGIYGMAKALGHRAVSLNAILANRPLGKFSSRPAATVDKMIRTALELIV
jgi:uridine phosphorylase